MATMTGSKKWITAWAAAALGVSLAAGCSSEEEDPKVGNGVNDVAKACDLRLKWNRSNPDCSLCEAAAISPRCDCSELKAFSAVCSQQQDSRKAACSEPVDSCVYRCDRNDCACIIGCYVVDDACKRAADARDGCVAEACANYCK